MTKDEALMHLTVAYGHHLAVADFNISAVNYVLDSLIQAEREACAEVCEQAGIDGYGTLAAAVLIRARGQA